MLLCTRPWQVSHHSVEDLSSFLCTTWNVGLEHSSNGHWNHILGSIWWTLPVRLQSCRVNAYLRAAASSSFLFAASSRLLASSAAFLWPSSWFACKNLLWDLSFSKVSKELCDDTWITQSNGEKKQAVAVSSVADHLARQLSEQLLTTAYESKSNLWKIAFTSSFIPSVLCLSCRCGS